jgi:hypothetical protein
MERRPVKILAYTTAAAALIAVIALFSFWTASIWTGDERWAAMAIVAFFIAIVLAGASGLLAIWVQEQ